MKNYNLNTLTSIGVHYQRQSVFSILSHCSDTYQRAQNHKTLGPSTSHRLSTIATITLGLLVVLLGGLFFSHSAYAGTSIGISNSSNNISFGSVKPSTSGSVVTASDELTITTDCSAGSNVYISATNNSTTNTNLVNNAGSSNNTIATLSGTTIGTTALPLENNTWGFNTDSTAASNGNYYGLPAYANATDHAIYSGTNTTVPIYYGAKVTNALVPGKYIGQVLYTATVNTSCLFYTVTFNKNAEDATGTMADQTITPATSTPLTSNGFSRPGYIFLGWSIDQNATEPLYNDKQSVTDLTQGGKVITLYAIWGVAMQDWGGCKELNMDEYLTLYDLRDSKPYVVKKLRDGQCWMVQDLKLVGPRTLTSADSDVSSDFSLTASTDDPNTTNWCQTNDQACVNQTKVYYDSSAPENTAYYNWYTATAGTGTFEVSSSEAVTSSICPKGWRLPTGGSVSGSEFARMFTGHAGYYPYPTVDSVRGDYAVAGNAGFSSFAGAINGPVAYQNQGRWWSLNIAGPTGGSNVYTFTVFNSSQQPSTSSTSYRYNGMPMRCVTHTTDGYMQDFNCAEAESGKTIFLKDKRDDQWYSVYRIPTDSEAVDVAGRCVMTRNLNIGIKTFSQDADSTMDSNGNITFSELDSEFTIPDPLATSQAKESITLPVGEVTVNNATSGWGYGEKSTVTYSVKQYFRRSSNGAQTEQREAWYNWGAAMVACPKGWRLPTAGEYSNIKPSSSGDLIYGIAKAAGATTGDTSTLRVYPWFHGESGYRYDWAQGGGSGYFTSTQLPYNSDKNKVAKWGSGYNTVEGYKSYANTVRCIAKEPTITIMYDSNGGTGTIEPQTNLNYGDSVTLRKNTSFAKEGYYFKGWGTNIDKDNTKFNAGETYNVSDIGVDGTVVLHAIWGQITDSGNCTASNKPTISKSCVMADGNRWILGHDGQNTTWYDMFASTNGDLYYEATLRSGFCPGGYSAPTHTVQGQLMAAYGGTPAGDGYMINSGTNTLVTILGDYAYWSTTETSDSNAYRMVVDSSWGAGSYGSYNKNNNYRMLCYKPVS